MFDYVKLLEGLGQKAPVEFASLGFDCCCVDPSKSERWFWLLPNRIEAFGSKENSNGMEE
jgi:hypothetical protein